MTGIYILMHKDEEVAILEFDGFGTLKSIKVINEKLMPPGIFTEYTNPNIQLQKWIISRELAANRHDLIPYRDFYQNGTFDSACGISLMDCYWVCPIVKKDNYSWEKINAFHNWDYSNDIIWTMLYSPEDLYLVNSKNSPNLTMPGNEPRLWKIKNNKYYLLSKDAQNVMMEYKKAKEARLSIIAPKEYELISKQIFAKWESECDESIESISFYNLYQAVANPDETKTRNLVNCCQFFDIPGWKGFFEELSELEKLSPLYAKELYDIHVLRNSESLEYIGFERF